jgi:hypothetical protein
VPRDCNRYLSGIFIVLVGKELLTKCLDILNAAKAFREYWAVFEGLEPCFEVRVIVLTVVTAANT